MHDANSVKVTNCPDIQLRPMLPDDCGQVATLHAELDHSSWSEIQWLEALTYCPSGWVLESKGQLVGYLLYQTRVVQVELLNIGVDRRFQSKGLAFDFVKATISMLPNESESVFLEVRRSNIPAIGLYAKLGFALVGERKNYYPVAGGTREDALVYKFDLSADSTR